MKIFRTQFEIRYKPIFDFSNVYKRLLWPFLSTCEFGVVNENSQAEIMAMSFATANYNYDLRADRFIFLSEGHRSDLVDAQGPLFMFFQIFKIISEHQNFRGVLNMLLQEYLLMEMETDFDALAEQFASDNFSSKVPISYKDFKKDYAISMSYEKDKKELKATYGPFNYILDVDRYALSPIHKRPKELFKDDNGIIIQFIYYEPATMSDMNLFRRFIETRSSFIRELPYR